MFAVSSERYGQTRHGLVASPKLPAPPNATITNKAVALTIDILAAPIFLFQNRYFPMVVAALTYYRPT